MSRSPVKVHGAKTYLADWIISLMPEHTHYVEPYFGGGSILFSKPDNLVEGHSEVVNDLNGEIVNFFRCLSDEYLIGQVMRSLQFVPFSEQLFKESCEVLSNCGVFSDTDPYLAVQFFIKNRQSRQGLGKDFATLSRNRVRRGMNEQCSSWLTAINELGDFSERLRKVAILNRPALDVIRTQDGPNTLHVLDPPYHPDTRVAGEYDHEMTNEDHEELLDSLIRVQGKFLLCGYHCDLYDKWAADNGIEVFEKEVVAHSSSAATKPKRTEAVWRKK